MDNHVILRNIEKWGSTGKFHNEPLVFRKLKDLSDSHLLHIIAWIEARPEIYTKETLQNMKNEQVYRKENYIFVKEYKD